MAILYQISSLRLGTICYMSEVLFSVPIPDESQRDPFGAGMTGEMINNHRLF